MMLILAVALSFGTTLIDEGLDAERAHEIPYIFRGGTDGAREVLSVIASTVITVAGVVFSVTITALALAASQYGPLVLRNFMSDRGNQLVLGTFLSTFLYSLLVLRKIRGIEEMEFVPHISVTVALVLALASIGVLIFFIHHVSSSIQASTLVSRVAQELRQSIDYLFPDEAGDEPTGPGVDFELPRESQAHKVRAPHGGYLESLKGERLVEAARKHKALVYVPIRPGEFVGDEQPIALIWGPGPLTEAKLLDVTGCFSIKRQRSTWQDVAFGFDQLEEMAVRALSTGINDPHTARLCIDRIGEGLVRLAGRSQPDPRRLDEEGALRVVARTYGFAECLARSLGRIRHHASDSPSVLEHLTLALTTIALATTSTDQREAVRREATALSQTIESFQGAEEDKEELRNGLKGLQMALELRANLP
jgi:uncharacterized membrane protein